MIPLGLILILSLFMAGCGLFKIPPGAEGFEGHCSPAATVGSSTPDETDRGTAQGLSRAALGIASTLKLTPLFQKMTGFESAVTKEPGSNALNLVRVHQQILGRTLLVSFEISGLAAEVDCDRTRVDNILDSMEKAQSSRSNTETAASVILSGVTNIITGGFTLAANAVADAIAAIAGGTLAGGLGALAVTTQTSYDFKHERNLLKEVWEDREQSQVFPKQVWRLLTEKRQDGRTLREKLLANWREKLKELNKKQGKDRSELLFGDGGEYGIEELRTRLTMLEGLSAMLKLMHQDLHVLVQYLVEKEEGLP